MSDLALDRLAHSSVVSVGNGAQESLCGWRCCVHRLGHKRNQSRMAGAAQAWVVAGANVLDLDVVALGEKEGNVANVPGGRVHLVD